MRWITTTLFLLSILFVDAQKSYLAFELNGRASFEDLIKGKRVTQNPFKQFIGEWTLKGDVWIQNWGNKTDTIKISKHHTISSQINTENSLFSIIDGPEPNGHTFWSYNPNTKKFSHLSSFGTIRAGKGMGEFDEKGNLKVKVSFEGEAPGTYRIYTYKWMNPDEYALNSIQFDENDNPTGLFYKGNFIRINSDQQNERLKYSKKLEQIHQDFISAAKEKNPVLILDYYSDSTLFIPEFHPLILGKNNIKKYYSTIYNRQTIQSYQRKSEDVICFSDRVVEWGTFSLEFDQKGGGNYTLIGKFMNVWKILKNEDLQLLSEQWNYDHQINEDIQLSVNIDGLPLRYQTWNAKNINSSLKYELDAYYLLGAKAVIERDPYGRLNSFAPNGIFLAPHGETAKIGVNAIKEYLINYNAGEVTIDSIDVGFNHVEDYGEFVIKNNYYYVKASGDGWTYEGQGLGSDLMQRNPNGQLRRLWQIGSEFPVSPAPIPNIVNQFEKVTLESLLHNEVSKRNSYYTDKTYLMGEYQKVLKGKSNLENYYQAFLKRFKVNSYEKQIVELLDLGNWMVETGTFEMNLTQKGTATTETYQGKYQNLWQREENGEWKVFAEAWNYNHPIEDWSIFSFPELEVYDHLSVRLESVPIQVLAHNSYSEEIISNHDDKKWAQLYDEQGMLLYSHSPLYNGKSAISAHLKEHVKTLPTFNTLDIGNFFLSELDEYIIELGNHYVDWSLGENQGISTGKNIRIWKKHPNGSIKVFRQTAMYDFNETRDH